nr:MAG TPA: hypothetical protein [Caudoviricetes sp.]
MKNPKSITSDFLLAPNALFKNALACVIIQIAHG